MSEDLEAKVKEIISTQLEVSMEDLVPEASFIDDLDADSLDMLELVQSLEEELKLRIPDGDTKKIKTVGDVMDYVKSNADKVGSQARASR